MYWQLFMDSAFNRNETKLFRQIVKRADVVFDIGANFGWYTTLFALHSGPTGTVHAFEPSPTTFRELQEQIALNHTFTQKVRLNQLALGNEQGKLTFYSFPNLPHGHNSLSDLGRDDGIPCQVRVQRLDDYLDEAGVAQIDLIKCDVEGAEKMVIEGAQQLLQSSSPPLWLLEMNEFTAAQFGYRPSELLRHLEQTAGYDTFWACEATYLYPLERLEAYQDGQTILCAISALHRQRLQTLPFHKV